MASKKELMKRIEELEARLLQLENMHARVIPADSWQSTRFMAPDPFETYVWEGKEGSYCGRQLTKRELRTRHEHPLTKERTAWTKKISGVTHEELARYVLDGEPIKREKVGGVTYVTAYAHDTVTKSVKTDLGGISMTERQD